MCAFNDNSRKKESRIDKLGCHSSFHLIEYTKHKENILTFVFAAIQLEVSLSSSHFLIHFFNHC